MKLSLKNGETTDSGTFGTSISYLAEKPCMGKEAGSNVQADQFVPDYPCQQLHFLTSCL